MVYKELDALTGSKKTIKNNRTRISWTMTEILEDLDFADDIALLSHRHRGMQEKNPTILQIQQKRLARKSTTPKQMHPITSGGQTIEEVQNFVYLGSKITEDVDSITDFLVRISMATGAYAALQNIWDRHKLQNHDL